MTTGTRRHDRGHMILTSCHMFPSSLLYDQCLIIEVLLFLHEAALMSDLGTISYQLSVGEDGEGAVSLLSEGEDGGGSFPPLTAFTCTYIFCVICLSSDSSWSSSFCSYCVSCGVQVSI